MDINTSSSAQQSISAVYTCTSSQLSGGNCTSSAYADKLTLCAFSACYIKNYTAYNTGN